MFRVEVQTAVDRGEVVTMADLVRRLLARENVTALAAATTLNPVKPSLKTGAAGVNCCFSIAWLSRDRECNVCSCGMAFADQCW